MVVGGGEATMSTTVTVAILEVRNVAAVTW